MIYDNGTNVGIGIEAQTDAKLYVQGALNIPAARFLRQASFGTVVEIGRQGYSAGASFGYPDDNVLSINTNGSERMRITSGGSVLINNTSAIGIGTLEITYNGQIKSGIDLKTTYSDGYYLRFLNSSGTSIGSITGNGTVTAYNVTSDYRLKQDFKSFNGLDLVSKIKVYDYEWKSDNSRMNGVIAHELQEVVPYAVTGEKDAEEMQQVDYSKLVPILVQAIQELQEKINKLENK